MSETTKEQQSAEPAGAGFFAKHGATVIAAVFLGYLALLATGVVAEVFKIQSILDWWIWRPPGK